MVAGGGYFVSLATTEPSVTCGGSGSARRRCPEPIGAPRPRRASCLCRLLDTSDSHDRTREVPHLCAMMAAEKAAHQRHEGIPSKRDRRSERARHK